MTKWRMKAGRLVGNGGKKEKKLEKLGTDRWGVSLQREKQTKARRQEVEQGDESEWEADGWREAGRGGRAQDDKKKRKERKICSSEELSIPGS